MRAEPDGDAERQPERDGDARYDRGKSAVESTDTRSEGIVDDAAREGFLSAGSGRRRATAMPLATVTVASSSCSCSAAAVGCRVPELIVMRPLWTTLIATAATTPPMRPAIMPRQIAMSVGSWSVVADLTMQEAIVELDRARGTMPPLIDHERAPLPPRLAPGPPGARGGRPRRAHAGRHALRRPGRSAARPNALRSSRLAASSRLRSALDNPRPPRLR
jgi:hypothetical protein